MKLYSTNVDIMFMIVLITIISVANCLISIQDNNVVDDDIKKVITKYVEKVPDIEPQYAIHEGLSHLISRFLKGKVSTFPLFKISLKIDRDPVKIPWTMINPNSTSLNLNSSSPLRHSKKKSKKRGKKRVQKFKYVPNKKRNKTTA